MFKASNIHYEVADSAGAVNCGGIGAMHLMVQRLGLVYDIDRHLELLKVPLPYRESDHVPNLAFNLLAGGQRWEDIELRRHDEVFRNGLGAERIPDPATAGDFTRRFRWPTFRYSGMYPSGAPGGVEDPAGRIPQGSICGRGRDDCRHLWRVQAGDGNFLQRHLGLCAFDCEPSPTPKRCCIW